MTGTTESELWRRAESLLPRLRERAARCEELGLLSTGSADFHGPENRLSSRFMDFEKFGLEPNLGPIADLLN